MGDLEQAKVSFDAIVAKMAKVEKSNMRITDVMTQSFTPLKEGSVEIQDGKRLLKTVLSIGKDLEFEPSLLAIMPAALNQTSEKRSPYEVIVLQQFETGLLERLAKVDEEIGSIASAKIEETASFNTVSAVIPPAKQRYETSLVALKKAQGEQRNAQAAHDDAVLEVKQGPLERDISLAACESAQSKIIAFQTGPLTAFYELEKWVTQTPISESSVNEVPRIAAVPVAMAMDAVTETVEVDSDMANDDEMKVEVAGKLEVGEPIEGEKLILA